MASEAREVAAIDILHLIDRLEEEIGAARSLPWGDGVIISRRRLLEIIDQMRIVVPTEVKEATQIIGQRDAVLARAEEEAARIIAQARQEQERLLNDQEVIRASEQRAAEIVREAEARASTHMDEAASQVSQQMADADRYALEMLRRLDMQISAFLSAIQNGIKALEERQH